MSREGKTTNIFYLPHCTEILRVLLSSSPLAFCFSLFAFCFSLLASHFLPFALHSYTSTLQ
jgi:hypothetical protein